MPGFTPFIAAAAMGPIEITVLACMFGGMIFTVFTSRTTKLVLQKLVAHEAASGESQAVIELVGRQQGIISFCLTLIGLSPITELTVTRTEVCCNTTSMFGRVNHAIPLRSVCSVAAGTQKPISYIVFAGLFLMGTMLGGLRALWNNGVIYAAGTILVGLLLTALFVWLYAIKRRFFLSIHAAGGPSVVVSFTPNVIEGVPLDLDRALRIVKLFRDQVLEATPSGSSTSDTGPRGRPPEQTAPQPDVFSASSPIPPGRPQFIDSDTDDQDQAGVLLAKARELIRQSQRDQAITVLREITNQFPDSREAQVARSTLEKAGIVS